MYHDRDSGIAFSARTVVDEPTPVSFPVPTDPDLQKPIPAPPPLPLKNTDYEKPPRYIYDYHPYPEKPLKKANDNGGDRTQPRARVKSLSGVPSSALVKLLLKDESVSKKTRKLLAATVSQLESATQRAAEAEAAKRTIENKSLVDKAKLSTDAAQAKDEAHRMKLELEMYRLKLRQAEDEVRRAHESVKVLDERRHEAEKAAMHAKMAARKYRGEKLVIVARQQGRSEGYKQGLTLGREIASARMKELELSGGYDDDYYSPEIVGDGHAYIEEYNDDQDGDQGVPYSTKSASSHPRDRKRDEHHHPRSRHLSMSSRPTSRREAESSRRQSNSTRGVHHANRDPEPRKSQPHHTGPPVVEPAAGPPIPPPVVQQTPLQQTPSQRPPSTAPSSPALPIPPPRPSQVSRGHNGYARESNTASPVAPLQQQQSPPMPSQPQSQPTPNSNYTPSSQRSEPEVIAIREPAQYIPPSPASQRQSQISTQTQPLVQSPFSQPPPPPMNTLPPQQPQSPQVDPGVLEYVPMPEPPITISPEPPAPAPAQPQATFLPPPPQMNVPPLQSPTKQVVQAPVPQTSSRNSSRTEERAREREAEVSTPSTMTGISAIAGGLRSFPAAPVPPSSAGSGGGGGGVPGYVGSNESSTGGGDLGFNPRLGGGERRRELSTIYEHSTEGTPRMLTPHNTGLSQRSDTSSRVDEWRKSLSLAGEEQEQERSQTPRASNNAYSASFLHPPSSGGRPPFYTSDSQGTLDSNLSSNRYSIYDNNLQRRTSSGSTRSTRSASININIEPPSRPTSADTRTPVPERNGGHSGDYAPFNTAQNMAMSMGMSQSDPSTSAPGPGYQPPVVPSSYGYVPPDQRMTPGYLSPNRSPMDLAPIAPDLNPGPPVIPGQGLAKLKSQVLAGGQVPAPVNNGLPAGFIPIHVQPSPGQSQRPIPRTYDQDGDDDDGEDTETEGSTTSSRRNLMTALYSGSPMGAIPPGVVTGGSPLARPSSLGSAAPKYSTGTGTRFATGATPVPSSSSSGGDRWPPGPAEPLSNPLPRPPQAVSWGDTTRAPQVYGSASSGHFEPPRPPSAAAGPVNVTPIPIPNPTLNWRGTPRMSAGAAAGNFSPSMVSAMDQMLPGGNSPRSQSQNMKRSSMHAGITPLSSAQPLPSAMKSWRNSASTSASTSGKSPLLFGGLRGFPAADSVGSRTASGSGSGDGSPSDSDSEFDAQTQENTLANARMRSGGSPYMMPMPMPPSMPVYRS